MAHAITALEYMINFSRQNDTTGGPRATDADSGHLHGSAFCAGTG